MKTVSIAVLLAFASFALPAAAAEPTKDVKGLYLLTDYPAVTVRPGTTSTVSAAPAELRPRRPSDSRSRSTARRPAGPRRCSAAASRSPPRCRRPTRASPCSFASTCRPTPISASQTLTVKAEGRGQPGQPAAHHHPRQGAAGQARGHAAAALAARHPEVELRLYPHHQERQRAQSDRQLRRDRAAQFRDLVHRSLRHPGTLLDADRRRPLQGHQAQGAAAEHDRCRDISRSR